MNLHRIIAICLVLFNSYFIDAEPPPNAPIITVKQGQIRGKVQISDLSKKKFYSFQGIPYAKPPVGQLRFQAPQPAEKWSGILNATREGSMCSQYDFLITQMTIGSEDCLFLNVYTPELPNDGEKPQRSVMMFIHGGAFEFGGATDDLFSPDYLMDRDIIFVSINYRLHVMGFLSLNIPECTGNFGLKDMVLALQWIKENIASFGGDSNSVTIFGESAGGASVNYLLMSPLAEGLFHRAILQSGVSLNPWSFTTTPVQSAFEYGKSLGFTGTDEKELLAFFQTLSHQQLTSGLYSHESELKKQCPAKILRIVFSPSREIQNDGAFLSDYPWELNKKSKRVPMIFGTNDQEGLLAYFVDNPSKHFELYNENPDFIVRCNYDVDENNIRIMTDQIMKFYFGSDKVHFTQDQLLNLTNLYTDYIFAKDIHKTVRYYAADEKYPVYEYFFTYDSMRNFYKHLLAHGVKIKGASHADEIPYMFFGKLFPSLKYTEDDLYIIHNVVAMWTNFAKTGNPNGPDVDVNWKPTTNEKPVYLEIKKKLDLKYGEVFEERMSFWKNLETKYYPREH